MADFGNCPDLKTSINNKIYTNSTFDVSAEDIRSSFEDTIDTLCALIESATGCEIQTYSDENDYLAITARVIVCNDTSVEIVGSYEQKDNFVSPGVYTGSTLTLTDVIPQNYKSKKWLKVQDVVFTVSTLDTNVNSFGYFELNDLNSYNSGGDDLGDFSSFQVRGGKVGDTTVVSIEDGEITSSAFDADPQTTAYIPFSPKDLSVDGLDIKLYNDAAHPNGDPSVGATIGTVNFRIKGFLY